MPNRSRSKTRTLTIAVAAVALSAIGAGAAIWQSSAPSVPPVPTISPVGTVHQANIAVGFGVGARFASPAQIEFSEITNAGRFDFREEFEFQKYVLKVVRVYEVKDQPSPGGAASHENRTLRGIVAKVVAKRK